MTIWTRLLLSGMECDVCILGSIFICVFGYCTHKLPRAGGIHATDIPMYKIYRRGLSRGVWICHLEGLELWGEEYVDLILAI